MFAHSLFFPPPLFPFPQDCRDKIWTLTAKDGEGAQKGCNLSAYFPHHQLYRLLNNFNIKYELLQQK